jgi:hypothetical protein
VCVYVCAPSSFRDSPAVSGTGMLQPRTLPAHVYQSIGESNGYDVRELQSNGYDVTELWL